MDWFKFYIGDFMRDTTRLTFEEKGSYLNLMMVYYADESPLSLNMDEVDRATGAVTDTEKEANRRVIRQFFDKKRSGYHKKRINEEIKKYQKRREINKANRNKSSDDSSHDSTDEQGVNTRNQKPETRINTNVFIPPTLEEVIQYFAAKGYSPEAAERAFGYYSELDWHNSRGKKISNWKTTMINNWFKPENKIQESDDPFRGAI